MADVAGITLKEPEQINWDNVNTGGKFVAPPQAENVKGERITYYGEVPRTIEVGTTKDGETRQFTIDPIKIVRSSDGNLATPYSVRFTRVNTRMWKDKRTGEPLNLNSAVLFLKSVGSPARPQLNSEYESAIRGSGGRLSAFTIDWTARNKDTGEEIKGYRSFPVDPDRPGQRKAILKQGDTYNLIDAKGNVVGTDTVKSEVLFANVEIKRFVDQTKK